MTVPHSAPPVRVVRTASAVRRAVSLLALGCAGVLLAWRLGLEPLRVLAVLVAGGPARLDAAPLDQVLSGLSALVLLAASGWVVAIATALVVETSVCVLVHRSARRRATLGPFLRAAARSRTLTRRLCPRAVRRAMLVGCGLAVGTGLAAIPGAPAAAVHAGPSPSGPDLAGLAVPDRVSGGHARRTSCTVRVVAGDSLWAIAQDRLPASTSNDVVTRSWRRLYRLNRARIGPDPDLILPGTVLRLPFRLLRPKADP